MFWLKLWGKKHVFRNSIIREDALPTNASGRHVSLSGSDSPDDPPKMSRIEGVDPNSRSLSDSGRKRPFHWRFAHAKDYPITENQKFI